MDAVSENVGVVRAYLAAIERFDPAGIDRCLDPDVVQTEFPNRLYPKGQVRGFRKMREDLPKGETVLRAQTYRIDTIFGAASQVVVEAKWEGVLNVSLGKLRPGDTMIAHICMVFTLEGGKITVQRNYDCYEDFTAE